MQHAKPMLQKGVRTLPLGSFLHNSVKVIQKEQIPHTRQPSKGQTAEVMKQDIYLHTEILVKYFFIG